MRIRRWGLTIALAALPLALLAQAPQPDPKDPKYQGKGEQDRSYAFPGTAESIAYHLYVPAKWDKNTKLPLIVALHGGGQQATAPFMRPMANPTLGKTAEERGYIVVAPTGYHTNATGAGAPYTNAWNSPFAFVPAPRPAGARGGGGGRGGAAAAGPTEDDFKRSEQDVLFVADLVAKEYNVDPERIYLMGNSTGGGAVWYYGEKYADRWTAISPSAGPLMDEAFPYDKLKKTPVLVVHGDMDTTMSFEGSKTMVDHAKSHGVDAAFLPVAGGMHTDAWAQPEVIKQIFDFFDRHKTRQK
jgi:poly(3-hydroxybutyrate) depolymerase